MTFQEKIAADAARYAQEQIQPLCAPAQDEKIKSNVDLHLCKILGEMLLTQFPELHCFHPQSNSAANDREFRPFKEFLSEISEKKTLQKYFEKMIMAKKAEVKNDESPGNM